MICSLQDSTEKLTFLMSADPAANQPLATVMTNRGCKSAALTGDAALELLTGGGPGGDEVIGVQSIVVYNNDTSTVQVKIARKVASTSYVLHNATIPAGGSLVWVEGQVPTITPAGSTILTTVGASAQAEVAAAEGGFGNFHETLLTLTAMPLTLTDALAYVGKKLYDFPAGRIQTLACVASLTFTTTSAIAGTLNSGVTVSWGLGSATASATTLATTMQNFLPGSGETPKTFTSSTVIDVAPATVTGFLAAVAAAQLAAILDGTTTAADLFLNIAVPTGTDIDADATLTVTGTVRLTWINEGDV